MILKRVVKGDVIKNLYESSNVLGSTFNKTTKDLVVIFKNGSQYKYNGVSETDYLRLETADSQGKVINTHIKKYSVTKLDDADIEKINREIEEERQLAKKGVLDKIIVNMKSLIVLYNNEDPINESDLDIIVTNINEYKTL